VIIEIALGIVLAWIIISLLPLIVAGGLLLLVIGIAALIFLAVLLNWAKALVVASGVVTFAAAIGVPYVVGLNLLRRFPSLHLAIDGKEPFNSWRALPVRVLFTAPYVFGLVALGLGLLFAGFYGVEWVEATLVGR
jgi:hypothetical protein